MYSTVNVVASWVIVGAMPQPPPPPKPPPRPPPPAGAPAAGASIVHLPAKFGFACASKLAAIMTTAAALSIAVMRFIVRVLLNKSSDRAPLESLNLGLDSRLLEPQRLDGI